MTVARMAVERLDESFAPDTFLARAWFPAGLIAAAPAGDSRAWSSSF